MKRGFTLIELLVVLAILAMLAALIIPAVMQVQGGKFGQSYTTGTPITNKFTGVQGFIVQSQPDVCYSCYRVRAKNDYGYTEEVWRLEEFSE